MDAKCHLASIRRDSIAFAAAARRGLERSIPSCPGWSMADLVWHTGTAVHVGDQGTRSRAGLAPRSDEAVEAVGVVAPPDDLLVEWFEVGAARVVATLEELDPNDTLGREWIESGYPGPSLARHYAREVGVHRWDAEAAWGTPSPPDHDLGADWLDGVLTTWLPRASRQGRQAQGPWAGERVQFKRSDGPQRWLVTLRPGAVTVSREEAEADVAVQGRGADLLLLAMNRIPPTGPLLEVTGDVGILDRWAHEIRYGRPARAAHWFGSPRPERRRSPTPMAGPVERGPDAAR